MIRRAADHGRSPRRSIAPRLMLLILSCMTMGASTPPRLAEHWGTLADGHRVFLYRLTNERGMQVDLTDMGAAIVAIRLARPEGWRDMVVGPGTFEGFSRSKRYGAIIGRYAGRLGSSVTIDGRLFPLDARPDGVTLHGGDPGFDRAMWTARPFSRPSGSGIEFSLLSPAGAQKLPGRLQVTARYMLARRRNILSLELRAITDSPTIVNLTNHVYFNLSDAPTVGSHCLSIDARREITVDARKLPTGTMGDIANSQRDFRHARPLAPLLAKGGLDTMFALDRGRISLTDQDSGESLAITTSEPGVQVYTGNSFTGTDRDARGRQIRMFGGIALETQHFPDSPNQPGFPSTRIAPDRPLHSWTRWQFDRKRLPDGNKCRAPIDR